MFRSLIAGLFLALAFLAPAKADNFNGCTQNGSNTTLNSNDYLWAGQECTLANMVGYVLSFQSDGNLVLYYVPSELQCEPTSNSCSGGTVVWSSGTNGLGIVLAGMQPSGYLTLENSSWTSIWDIPTTGHTGDYLFFDSTGALKIKQPDGTVDWSR